MVSVSNSDDFSMKNFYITGLPRSRTTWMSMVFNAHGLFCWHEGMNNCLTKDDYRAKMEVRSIVGNADCGLPYCDILEDMPGPMVVIEREPKDVQKSLNALGMPCTDERLDAMVEGLAKVKGMRIPFDQLDKCINDIFNYCVDRPSHPLIMNVMHNIKAEPLYILNNGPCWEVE